MAIGRLEETAGHGRPGASRGYGAEVQVGKGRPEN